MKTEQAIKLLNRLQDEQFDGIHGDERREALDMAVRALFSQQTVNDSQGLVNDCISRKMAIDAFEPEHHTDWYTPTIIETLEALPSAQPETHDKRTETHECDLISRQAAIDRIRGTGYADQIKENVIMILMGVPSAQPEPSQVARDICTILENEQDMRVILKNAQPERKKGKWVWNQYDKPHIGNYHCSVCRNIAIEKYTYCPNCGADMRGENDEL